MTTIVAMPPLPILDPGIPVIPAARSPVPAVLPLFLHKLAAGFPSPATDYIEQGLDLNIFMVQHKEASYFFRVMGESMSGAGILDGDIVLVDRSVTPAHGHYVLAVIDSEYTLKRFHHVRDCIELRPENPAFSPFRWSRAQSYKFGVS